MNTSGILLAVVNSGLDIVPVELREVEIYSGRLALCCIPLQHAAFAAADDLPEPLPLGCDDVLELGILANNNLEESYGPWLGALNTRILCPTSCVDYGSNASVVASRVLSDRGGSFFVFPGASAPVCRSLAVSEEQNGGMFEVMTNRLFGVAVESGTFTTPLGTVVTPIAPADLATGTLFMAQELCCGERYGARTLAHAPCWPPGSRWTPWLC